MNLESDMTMRKSWSESANVMDDMIHDAPCFVDDQDLNDEDTNNDIDEEKNDEHGRFFKHQKVGTLALVFSARCSGFEKQQVEHAGHLIPTLKAHRGSLQTRR